MHGEAGQKTQPGGPGGRRLIGDSQASYWFLAMECFLKMYLVSEQRQQPTDSPEANMWLIKYVEDLPHRGSKRAEPRPAMCTDYQAGARTPAASAQLLNDACFAVMRRSWLYDVAHSRRMPCAHAKL